MVLTRNGKSTGRVEDQINRLQMYYNQRNEACACGGRNGDCNCPESDSYNVEDSSFMNNHYREKDQTCHRHRKPDDDPKSVKVTTYKRRKPIK